MNRHDISPKVDEIETQENLGGLFEDSSGDWTCLTLRFKALSFEVFDVVHLGITVHSWIYRTCRMEVIQI